MKAYSPRGAKPVCYAPARYGGLSAARKYSRADLGYIWTCNRPVLTWGLRCYQHTDVTLNEADQRSLDGRAREHLEKK